MLILYSEYIFVLKPKKMKKKEKECFMTCEYSKEFGGL